MDMLCSRSRNINKKQVVKVGSSCLDTSYRDPFPASKPASAKNKNEQTASQGWSHSHSWYDHWQKCKKLHALWKHDAQKTQSGWLLSTTCSPENGRPSPSWSSSSLAVDVSAPNVARRRPGRLSRPEGHHPNARRGRKNCGEKSTCPHQRRKSTSKSSFPKRGNTQPMCQREMNG